MRLFHRKRGEGGEELQFYREIVDEISIALLFVDRHGKITFANPRAKSFLGKDVIGKRIEDIVPREHRPEVMERFNRRKRGEEVPPYETEIILRDGRRIWVRVVGTPRKRRGRFEGVYVAAREVTPWIHERREEERRGRLLEAIYDATPDAIMISDKEGLVSFFNKGAEEIFGYNAQEVIGTPVSQYFVSPQEAFEVRRLLDEAPDGRIKSHIVRFRHKEGREIYLALSAALLKGPQGEEGVLAMGKDVTEEQRRIEEIRRLQEFNEYVLNMMGEGLNVIDEKGVVLRANLRMAQMLGYNSPQEIVHKHWRELYAPESIPIVERELQKRKRGESSQYEALLLTKEGKRLLVRVSGTPLLEEGSYKGSIAVITDISDLKAKEKELEEKVAELQRWYRLTVDRELRMAELKKKIRELEERIKILEGGV